MRQQPRQRGRHQDQSRAKDVGRDQVEAAAEARKRRGGEADLLASELSAAFSWAFSRWRAISIALTSATPIRRIAIASTPEPVPTSSACSKRSVAQKFLDRCERAVSGRMMPGAKGLSGIDHQLKPPRGDVRIPWRDDQQAAANPQAARKRSIQAVAQPGSAISWRRGVPPGRASIPAAVIARRIAASRERPSRSKYASSSSVVRRWAA